MFTEELLKKAEAGYEYGQYNLGLCYHNGWGTLRDDDQALIWLRKAADQGHEDAKNSIENIMRERNN